MIENKKNSQDYTNFGFTKVTSDIKQSLVNNLFSNIANKYDIMNDVMSLGLHRLWKSEFCSHIQDINANILDVATGTGDVAIAIAKKIKAQAGKGTITMCDINQDMLDLAKDKTIDENLLQGISYVCANAEYLPFADNSFDYYTISFGIRNVRNIEKALSEALRVLKPGGKFVCLEFSKVECSALEKLYKAYSFNLIPKLGKIITGDTGAYNYLVESIELFPTANEFSNIIKDSGFIKVHYNTLSFGVVAIHIAHAS